MEANKNKANDSVGLIEDKEQKKQAL